MATYLVSELIERLGEIYQDEFSLVEIIELPADKDSPACISFNAVSSIDSVNYEEVEAVDFNLSTPPTKRSVSTDSLCSCLFTYAETATIELALNNAIEYFKEEINKPDCPRDLKDELKSGLIDFRNLKTKIVHFYKRLGITRKR